MFPQNSTDKNVQKMVMPGTPKKPWPYPWAQPPKEQTAKHIIDLFEEWLRGKKKPPTVCDISPGIPRSWRPTGSPLMAMNPPASGSGKGFAK